MTQFRSMGPPDPRNQEKMSAEERVEDISDLSVHLTLLEGLESGLSILRSQMQRFHFSRFALPIA